ncbi:hypothetical protein HZ994_11675 [Akkermansiaceae bacterium]|nr:hypothetical protein HZ994_11675 [Akkermansiaceae bacterium]
MKTSPQREHPSGYVSLVTVSTVSFFMLALMLFAYTRAINAQGIQSDIQTQGDYREKEETILRSIVAITPNRAIRAMQDGSNSTAARRNPLRWEDIFSEALTQSNARKSIPDDVAAALSLNNTFGANPGDSALGSRARMFKSMVSNPGLVSGGLNRDLGTGFPPALNSNTPITNDDIYPIISTQKQYGGLASGRVGLSTTTYKDFNILTYPQINFGYSKPGDPFVAKRNWWAFTMDLADHDDNITKLARFKRQFVLSIYEIPSQLPISAGSFMSLGRYGNGDNWENVTIAGNIFASRAIVEGNTALPGLATRRGSQLSSGTTIAGKTFNGNPFTPGVRETYRLTEGDFFPISLSSESGKAAFVPINRGADYFDRFAHGTESTTISPTTWNQYSVGALQCAMTLDISKRASASDRTPTELRFTYLKNGSRQTLTVPLNSGVVANLPAGYISSVSENQTVTFATPVDTAYGANGFFYYKNNLSGPVTFNNATFGDPIVGTVKRGYFKPIYPFGIKNLPNGRICVAVYPERFRDFLLNLGADGLDINNSLAVNVDYVTGSNLTRPNIPCTANDYGVILQECGNLTSFTKGFSLVTNLRLHIGGDFNIVPTTPPAGFTPPSGTFYPPCSLFAPEKRYGVELDPFGVEHSGQIGSLASESAANPIRPLDATGVSGTSMSGNRIKINLSPIRHPAELPPITMMNWLILIEERRKEYY